MHAITHYHLKIVDSTNEWAKRNIDRLNPENLTVIIADEQSAGRGRHNNLWVSPAQQNIYTTFCFYITEKRQDIGNLPQIMAISAIQVLAQLGFKIRIKWPNDLMLSNKKLGGILCETSPTSKGLLIILGIGININMPVEDLQKVNKPATSLLIESKTVQSVAEIQKRLQEAFAANLSSFLKEGFPPFLASFKQLLAMEINQQISFHDHQKLWEGTFHSINDDGSLNLELPSKEIKRFISGEIKLKREERRGKKEDERED